MILEVNKYEPSTSRTKSQRNKESPKEFLVQEMQSISLNLQDFLRVEIYSSQC